MVIRRIVTGVCALCLVTPAAAVAAPGTDPPKPQGPYGVTVTGPPILAKARGPYGATAGAGPDIVAKAKGPYGVKPVTGPPILAKARGPYGATAVTGPPTTARSTAHTNATGHSDVSSDWRAAAIGEAVLIAALALGLLGLAGVRNRAPRMVT
jgi:hypothetical protein